MSYPRIIAHRCGGALAPENTLVGLRLAARFGCRGVEFDAMLSRDGIPVLIHDDTLERTTGRSGAVAALDAAQLAALDAGARHHPAFAGERVPTLDAGLTLCTELGLWANVEIKPSAGREAETGAAVAGLLATRWNGAGVVSSFSVVALTAARAVAPELRYALLVEQIPPDWREQTAALGCTALHCGADADTGAIAGVAAGGLAVACYTVNRREEAERLFAAGAAAVFTDRPDLWRPQELQAP